MPSPGFAGSDSLVYEVCDDGTPALCGEATVTLTVSRVAPTVETDPVPHGAAAATDAADDAAIWVDPDDPARSVVIGTNKFSDATTNGGLAVYDLSGTLLHYTNDGRMNNVDLRDGFPLAGETVTLVTSTQRNGGSPPSPKRIWIYELDPLTRALVPVHSGTFAASFEPLGDCMYRSPVSGDFFVFVVGANGMVEQWRLSEGAGGLVDAAKVRTFVVGSTGSSGDIAEACVADDQGGRLYVSEEDVGIWKYSAEPNGGDARTLVDAVGDGHLTADVEGLAIAYGPGDSGYLMASSQGSSSFAVYRRESDNPFVRSFKIKEGAHDPVTETDGIDVTSASLGPSFPNGLFVAQDNSNAPDNQNFKLVPLDRIIETAGLAGSLQPEEGALSQSRGRPARRLDPRTVFPDNGPEKLDSGP
jgi:3-phytase